MNISKLLAATMVAGAAGAVAAEGQTRAATAGGPCDAGAQASAEPRPDAAGEQARAAPDRDGRLA